MSAYDHKNYAVGSSIHIGSFGWHPQVTTYTVSKITPSGQIVAKQGGREIRISPRGRVVGGSGNNSVISDKVASDLRVRIKIDILWKCIFSPLEDAERSVRNQDEDAFQSALEKITEAFESLKREKKS